MKLKYLALGGLITLAGAVSTPTVIDQVEIQNLPSEQRLKVSADSILTLEDDGTIVTYAYKDTKLVAWDNEIVGLRTKDSRTIKAVNLTSIYFDTVVPRIQDDRGVWWDTAQATTTSRAFELQTKPFLGGWLGSLVHAQTTVLLANPGKGNQTWTVPSDWNNTTNMIACIGAGGDSSPTSAASGASGGGGGAFASTTGVTLTPGGTATFAIGARATSSGVNASMANETYFGSTASSTATISCAFGKKPALHANPGLGGTTANSTGTTKFAGGNGGDNAAVVTGGGGGGGSAGPVGAGQNGGSSAGGAQGAGGGGSDGGSSSAGLGGASGTGGTGGNGTDGTGGGTGGDTGVAAVDGTAGEGAGGGGGSSGAKLFPNGATGSLDTAFEASYGASGGGGGGGGITLCGAGTAGSGGAGGTYGGGGGGGGCNAGATAGIGQGGQGIIYITYSPVGASDIPRTVIKSRVIINAQTILP